MLQRHKSYIAPHITHTSSNRIVLFDRINLDPMIQYVSITWQFADSVTQGSFTRDIWTQLTQLVNIMTRTVGHQDLEQCTNLLATRSDCDDEWGNAFSQTILGRMEKEGQRSGSGVHNDVKLWCAWDHYLINAIFKKITFKFIFFGRRKRKMGRMEVSE